MLTQARLQEVLHYDETTGVFTWRVSTNSRIRVGAVAGAVEKDGYIRIRVDGRAHRAHRIAWLYAHGEFPPHYIDHIDHCPANNRLANLRLATMAENLKNVHLYTNNTSGYKGVYWHKQAGKWVALARLNGRRHYLGCFTAAEAASEAYEAFAKQHHDEFYLATRTSHAIRRPEIGAANEL